MKGITRRLYKASVWIDKHVSAVRQIEGNIAEGRDA